MVEFKKLKNSHPLGGELGKGIYTEFLTLLAEPNLRRSPSSASSVTAER